MSLRIVTALVVAGTLAAGQLSPVVAQRRSSESSSSDIGIGIRAGTLGFGVQIAKLVTSHIGLRVGGDFFSLNLNGQKQSDITYDGKVKIKAFSGLLDLYPGARGSFHVTAGIVTDPAKVTATGVSTGGNFTINGNSYTSAQVGTLTATGKFGSSVEPYVGLGFGTAASRHGGLAFTFDIGLAIGKPSVTLTSTGASGNVQLQNDLNAQVTTTQKDLHKIPGYPVIALGLMYRF